MTARVMPKQKQPKLFGIYTFNAYLCKDNLCEDWLHSFIKSNVSCFNSLAQPLHRSSKEST